MKKLKKRNIVIMVLFKDCIINLILTFLDLMKLKEVKN